MAIPRDNQIEVTSPFFPEYYPDNVDCFWIVTSENIEGFIVVSFITLSLQNGEDFLTIGVGKVTQNWDVMARLTGTIAPRAGTVNGTALWIRFTTNNIGQIFHGFRLQLELSETHGKNIYLCVVCL